MNILNSFEKIKQKIKDNKIILGSFKESNVNFVNKNKIHNTKIKTPEPHQCFNLNTFSEDKDKLGKIKKDINDFDYSDFIEI